MLHLIRHGEGFHNVAGHKDPEMYKSFEFEDAHLTPKGWQQALALNKHIKAVGLKVDVVVSSPLTRTLETAVGAFSGSAWQGEADGAPLMVAQTELEGKRTAQSAMSAVGCPPFITCELCR